MILLHYVVLELMGPPDEDRAGEDRWRCPWCEHRGFHIRPHKPAYKDRWACWSCHEWGDALDLVRHFHPRETYGQRLDRLEQLRAEYRQIKQSEPLVFSPRGSGSRAIEVVCPECTAAMDHDELQEYVSEREFGDDVRKATRELMTAFEHSMDEIGVQVTGAVFEKVFRVIQLPLTMTAARGMHPLVMASQVGFRSWTHRQELDHARSCDDAECDAGICLMIRNGWTEEQLEQYAAKRRADPMSHPKPCPLKTDPTTPVSGVAQHDQKCTKHRKNKGET